MNNSDGSLYALAKRVLIIKALGLVAFLGLFMSAHAHAQTFIVGVEKQSYYPYYYHQEGELRGYGRDILDAFAKSQGYTFIYKAMAVDDLFKQLISRQVDFKFPDNPYWQYQFKAGVRIAYSEPVNPYIDGVSVLSTRKGLGIHELYRLGVLKGFTPLNYEYLASVGKVHFVERNTILELITLALDNKIDGVYGNIRTVSYQSSQLLNDKDRLVWDPILPYTAQSYRLSTAARPRMIKEFDAYLKREARFIKATQKKYGIVDLSEEQ